MGGDYAKAAHPKFTVGTNRQQNQTLSRSQSKQKKKPKKQQLTGEMSHLRILPRTRLCQNLARRNAPQVFGNVPAERILAATRRRRWALRRSGGGGFLSEDGRGGGEEAALCEADVVRQPAP